MNLFAVLCCLGVVIGHSHGLLPGPRLFVGEPAERQGGVCPATLFTSCAQSFRSSLNFTIQLSPDGLKKEFDDLLSTGLSGLHQLCDAMQAYYFCMGGNDALDTCFSVSHLTSMGMNSSFANGFSGIYHRTRFICGIGFQAVSNNYPCLHDTVAANNKTFQECEKQFIHDITDHPLTPCQNVGQLLDCVSMVFSHCSPQSVWAICSARFSELLPAFPECTSNITCTGQGALYPHKPPMTTTTAMPTTVVFETLIVDQSRSWNDQYSNIHSSAAQTLAFFYEREIYQTLAYDSAFPKAAVTVQSFTKANSTSGKLHVVEVQASITVPVGGHVPSAKDVQNAIEAGSGVLGFPWAVPLIRPMGPPTAPPQVGTSVGWQEAGMMYAASVDITADPCRDFFAFSCGNWQKAHPMPSSNFGQMFEDLLLEVAQQVDSFNGTGARSLSQAKLFYDSCVNPPNDNNGSELLDMVNALGGWPLIDSRWHVNNSIHVGKLMGSLFNLYGINTFISASVDTDWLDPTHFLLYIDQASLFYPTIYYQNHDFAANAIRQLGLMAKNLATEIALINQEQNGVPFPDIAQLETDIDDMLKMEYKVAMLKTPDTARRQQKRMYNKFTFAQAIARWPNMNWESYMDHLLTQFVDPSVVINATFVVQELGFLDNINQGFPMIDKKTVQNYLMFRLVASQSQFIPRFKKILLDFKMEMEGGLTAVDKMVSVGCANAMISAMPYIGGRFYIDGHFQTLRGDPRSQLQSMTENVQAQFKVMLEGLSWMDPATKQKAYDKLSLYANNYAYPDWMLNDTLLDAAHPERFFNLKPTDNMQQMVIKLTRYSVWYMFRALEPGFPVDRHSFVATPATINAFYAPEFNSITILAGIMNPPFFKGDYPLAVNYGGLGLVIGHETTHGFDDEGVQWNGVGNLTDWIDDHSDIGFDKMAECVIDEYSQFCYNDTTPKCINGANTQGENIADNGGIRAAFNAYKAEMDIRGPEPRLPGVMAQFSMEQVYFIAFAQGWCENALPSRLSQQLLLDPHSPSAWRVRGSVRNLDEFAEAFNCPPNTFENPQHQCDVWH